MKCKIDKSPCRVFLDFGKMPIANGFLKRKEFKKEYFFKLKVAFNSRLSLFQLEKNPNPKKMFNKNYPFYTSSSKFMIEHFKNFSNWIKNRFKMDKNFKILEIGSNDGTFLKNFKNYYHVGIEPSSSVHKIAIKSKINSLNSFFNYSSLKKFIKKKTKFDVIVGSNVICHIPNQNNLIKNIKKILTKNGLFIFEEPYLGSMYKKTSYDQIYDEHIYMFSASSIQKIYKIYEMTLIDAIPQNTHGGSMRYIVGRRGNISNRLKKILYREKKENINNIRGCYKFKKNVENSKKKLIHKLLSMKKKNQKICGYGATSKSTTILNYCNIGPKIIDVIFDTTRDKINKFSPGMHIPIVDYKYFKNSKYKNIFLFAWNHKKEILKKERHRKNCKWFSHLN